MNQVVVLNSLFVNKTISKIEQSDDPYEHLKIHFTDGSYLDIESDPIGTEIEGGSFMFTYYVKG